jgi:hypothetical protein
VRALDLSRVALREAARELVSGEIARLFEAVRVEGTKARVQRPCDLAVF